MNKLLPILLLLFAIPNLEVAKNEFIARQGQVSFFSYTSVENIEAKNNQVLSILDIDTRKIAISMLMRAFVFKKDLMYEHFNESYIESDIHPKANFEGSILNFNPTEKKQTRIIKGKLTIHGISKEVSIKTAIEKVNDSYILEGNFNVLVNDFDIRIPPILASNIAKSISVKFRFQYQSYEE